MFQHPLNSSQSQALLQLISIKLPSDSDSELDESVESLADNSNCEASVCNSESITETNADTEHSIGNPITHPAPLSNPQIPIQGSNKLTSHPLSLSISFTPTPTPPGNHLHTNALDFSSNSGLGSEKKAQSIPAQASWPPLMLRPIAVNSVPYYTAGELGRGATSVVHRVLDMDFKLYALKSVNLDDADQLMVDCYQNEILILQDLKNHSHVIHMFDYEYCPTNRSLFVVMECGQSDLARIIKANNNQPFELYKIQNYWHDMLQGVTAIHSMGIIHSDLKPNNFVLVNTDLKLIDFGIAYSLNLDATSFEREGRWGTPNYMAPEMILAIPKSNSIPSQPDVCKISQAADIWSLGCILYKLTYGTTPFQHKTDKIKKWIAITDPNEPILFHEDIPSPLLKVLISCLDRNPRKRPTGLQLLSQNFLTTS